ncbi:hypothetical protein [Deinococcus cellulosilyticus]|uniref:Uncharacterized protein n=1 Tax=Deinococcus cellulosilyticus (strain DSM 18568 / NBRC 106333 / KACC 11606 / 5516J-15) TaxID=1223518 RepID=A0A511N164_DEIC1|nr:hypothetical protein [Deinococcus cellulosilyticus]GEM46539.1 hypothetical protein DC3_21740 [Deinococcus cellulosilyticus NBRC 106333 = KACC 11606]
MDKPLNAHEEQLLNALDFGSPPPEGFFARFKELFEVQEALDRLPVLHVPAWLTEFMEERIHSDLFHSIFLNTLNVEDVLTTASSFTRQYLPPTYTLPERIMEDFEAQQILSSLPALKAPQGFASLMVARIQEDQFRGQMQQLKVQAPQGLASRIVERIQEDRLNENLQHLKVRAPEGFASRIVERIQDDVLTQNLQHLKVKAPEGFASRIVERIQEDLLSENLRQLKVKAPEGFASRIVERIQDDVLTENLQQLKVQAPGGFAGQVLQHIQTRSEQEMQQALQNLPEMKAPQGFSQAMAQRIQEAALKEELSDLKVKVPAGFANRTLQHMEARSEQETSAVLKSLPVVQAPEGFAAHVASRIVRDAHAQETHNPAPLYLVGMALLAAAFALFSFVFPNVQVGVSVLLDLASNISAPAIGVMVILAVISLFGLFSKVKFTPQITYAAFTIAMLAVYPNVQSAFGPATVTPQQEVASVVRVGGDVVVRGHVTGDVVALGGDITLVQGAKVDGRTVSLLGDVKADPGVEASVAPTAILGRVNGELPLQKTVLPSVGVASAFVPLMDLMKSEYWPAFYFAFLCIFTLLVYQSGHGTALVRQSLREPNRNLALGYVAFLLTLPVLLVSNLVGNGVLLGLSIALLVALTAGLSISLLLLGAAVTVRLRKQSHPVTFALIGLAVYLVLLTFPAVATVTWFAGGCYGLGVLLNYVRKTNVTHLKAA